MQFDLLQIFGVVLAITIITLDTRENVLARPLSLIGTTMSFFVYYPAGLYAKCILNCIYIVLNIYGWYQWLYGGKNKTPLQVSETVPGLLVTLVAGGLLVTWGLGKLLTLYSNAALPYWDSLHTVMCLVAQWMLVRKKLETWILWTIADILYTVVCYYKGLYLFSGLHAFYIILAINGYRTWHQSYPRHTAPGPVSSEDEMIG